MAFCNNLFNLCQKCQRNFIILPPRPLYFPGMTSSQYNEEVTLALRIEAIIAAVAIKHQIVIYPLLGLLHGICVSPENHKGQLSYKRAVNHVDEKLYNKDGSATRELRYRLGKACTILKSALHISDTLLSKWIAKGWQVPTAPLGDNMSSIARKLLFDRLHGIKD